MVYAKVTDGKEIRKFRVDSDVTFDALKKQIAGLFPSLADGADFNVQYRDADGDVISISTDEEVRTALSHLSSNETWLLQAVRVPKRAQRVYCEPGCSSIWRLWWKYSRAHLGRYEPVLDPSNVCSRLERSFWTIGGTGEGVEASDGTASQDAGRPHEAI